MSTIKTEKWWAIAKAIGYELRPFPMPTREDVVHFVASLKKNGGQIYDELCRVTPHACRAASKVKPGTALAVSAWVGGWALFTWFEFGVVYFIVSVMGAIFTNLREREEGEWSAYSVFNAGCEALLGTLSADQFEREIMHRNPAAAAMDNHDDHDGHAGQGPGQPHIAATGNRPGGAQGQGEQAFEDDVAEYVFVEDEDHAPPEVLDGNWQAEEEE
ncbi:unnamed protein product, partial [Discosporangium mesarthrocarpum]